MTSTTRARCPGFAIATAARENLWMSVLAYLHCLAVKIVRWFVKIERSSAARRTLHACRRWRRERC
jgi:hypothetical protein